MASDYFNEAVCDTDKVFLRANSITKEKLETILQEISSH